MALAKLSVPRAMSNKYTFADKDFNMTKANSAAATAPVDNKHETDDASSRPAQQPAQQAEQEPPATAPENHDRSRDTADRPRATSANYDSSFHSSDQQHPPS